MSIEITRVLRCDWCGEQITDEKQIVQVVIEPHSVDYHGNVQSVIFCSKDHANQWWRAFREGVDTDLIE